MEGLRKLTDKLAYFYGHPAATGNITMLRDSGIFGPLPPGKKFLCDCGFRGQDAHIVTPSRRSGFKDERRAFNKRGSASHEIKIGKSFVTAFGTPSVTIGFFGLSELSSLTWMWASIRCQRIGLGS